jgi:hypothetical protein
LSIEDCGKCVSEPEYAVVAIQNRTSLEDIPSLLTLAHLAESWGRHWEIIR